jgi:hypothetical protein
LNNRKLQKTFLWGIVLHAEEWQLELICKLKT